MLFRSDGEQFVVAAKDKSVAIWNATSGAAVRGQMRVHFVRTMDDVLDQLLLDAPLVTLADAAPTDQPPVSTTALSDRPARPRRPEPDRRDLEESR